MRFAEARRMVRAEGLEPPHLAILEPKSSASTSSATRARPLEVAAYSKDGRLGNPSDLAGNPFPEAGVGGQRRSRPMQQLPPFPDIPPEQPTEPIEPQPPTPGRP